MSFMIELKREVAPQCRDEWAEEGCVFGFWSKFPRPQRGPLSCIVPFFEISLSYVSFLLYASICELLPKNE